MKKVLFIATVESHLLNFHIPYMKYFQSKGCEVHVAAKLGDRKNEFHEIGVQAFNIDFSKKILSVSNLKAYKQLCNLMLQNKYSLIHMHTPIAAFIGRLAAKKTKSKSVLYTAHGFHFYKGAPIINWLIFYPLEKLAAYYTDGLITINREDYEVAKNFKLRDSNGLFYVPGVGVDINFYNFIDNDEIINFREYLKLKTDDFLITTIAELNKNKNQLQVIKAIRQINKMGYKNIKYLIVGEGPYYKKLKNKIEKYNLTENIILYGYSKEVPKIINSSDVIILTSKREGLPKCIMEAMAAGKPVIVTNVRGSRDLIINNENGYIISVNNINQTSKAILEMYNSKTIKQFGENSKSLIKKYSIDIIMKEYINVYNKYIEDYNYEK